MEVVTPQPLVEAIDEYDDVVARYSNDPAPDIRIHVAQALVRKGITLGALDRSGEAVGVYDDVVARFGQDATPDIRQIVDTARTLFSGD